MKAHLISSNEPLPEGEDRTAACGADVPKAVFLFQWDFAVDDSIDVWSTWCGCRRCLGDPLDGRYLYVILPGQESRSEVA